MKGIRMLFALLWALLSLGAMAVFGFGDDNKAKQPTTQATEKDKDDCQAPQWAISIGHEQMWKLHNGCPTDDKTTNKD